VFVCDTTIFKGTWKQQLFVKGVGRERKRIDNISHILEQHFKNICVRYVQLT